MSVARLRTSHVRPTSTLGATSSTSCIFRAPGSTKVFDRYSSARGISSTLVASPSSLFSHRSEHGRQHRDRSPKENTSVLPGSGSRTSLPRIVDTCRIDRALLHGVPDTSASSPSIPTPPTPAPEASISSWWFPTSAPLHKGQHHNATVPVQAWTSTSDALAQLYSSLQQIKLGDSVASASALQSALLHYNFLSHLQSTYNTVLIPRRETRTLYLLQGRQPKTKSNLEQLLRIAMDLIWLSDKDRQRTRSVTRSMAPYVHSYADNYHGLRPSEYTILMNWIGSVTALPELDQYRTLPLQHTSESLESSPPSSTHSGAQEHQDSVVFNGSTDRLWKIWQDFLLTGMKPDVVLYTTLMDSLLSAKEYGRASQIWSHMHQHADQDRKDGKDDTGLLREEAMSSTKVSQPVSEMLELGVERKQDHCVSSPEPRSPHLMDRRPLAPNTQTFSVLMKTYCLNRDLRGVTRTYQRLLQATDSRDKARSSTSTAPSLVTAPSQSGLHGRANTVLLNQILKVLIDLGETNAAMEIYTEMRKSGPDGNSHDNSEGNQDSGHTQEATPVDACPLPYSIGTFVLPHSDQTEQPPPEPAPEVIVPAPVGRKVQDSATTQWSTPLHHQMFSRRSTWNRHARKSKARGSTEWLAPSSIQPNETTLKLMLNLATLKKNDELEEMVLKDMSALGLKDCGVGGCGDAAFLSRG